MAEEKVLSIEEGTIAYLEEKNGIVMKRYRGIGKKAIVPESIEGKPVISIARKAFLSCKTLREIVLPNSIEEIGDWAFAHTEELRTITIPRRELTRGKELFLGCKRLREIQLLGTEEEQLQDKKDGINRMLAAAVTILRDYFLFTPTEVRGDAWITRWDEQLLKLVRLDDLDGFEELWTCGEEDYEGKDYDIKSYPVEKRKMKLRMIYFRLLHPYKLAETVKSELQQYLHDHTKGTKEPEAWEVLLEEHSEDIIYYQVFTEAGCVTEENFDDLLSDMQNVNAQMKAYMLKYKEEHLTKRDAFAAFELDW
ncbi:MAG: leucine-rich repeat domain-containing protein [Lachnospiraceae bacterium]|nr:leucine-rich repeat domain-containing protein [Lachnospiraceae bacterium]